MSKKSLLFALKAASLSLAATTPLLAAETSGDKTPPPPTLEQKPAATTAPVVASGVAIDTARKTSPAEKAAFAFWVENDYKWSDKYYTNGLKLAYTSPELFYNDKAPPFIEDLCGITPLASPSGTNPAAYRFHFGITQEIYTAKDEYIHNPPMNDHPYAGRLYGSIGISSETDYRLDVLELSLGVTGPSSLAKQAQNTWHGIIDDPKVEGWGTQFGNEPLIQFVWERLWRVSIHKNESFGIDVIPHLHLEAGTANVYASAGAQFRLGWNLPEDFGVSLLRTSAGTTRPARNANYDAPISWAPDAFYFYFDMQGEGWAWNNALDGGLWRDSNGRTVNRRDWIGQGSVGFAAHWGMWKLCFSQVVRSKEFVSQDHSVFVFSSVTLGVVF
ncbi:MAG: lipid A deacylase LpxR family protein [Puniceicoccales bacterium]|jgi:hypothetical protein|nr:lipid A deacylase LpxR family protein [Puniceicoccales bacterium]